MEQSKLVDSKKKFFPFKTVDQMIQGTYICPILWWDKWNDLYSCHYYVLIFYSIRSILHTNGTVQKFSILHGGTEICLMKKEKKPERV